MANNRPPVMRIIFQSKKGYLIASFKSFFNGSFTHKVNLTERQENPCSISDETES